MGINFANDISEISTNKKKFNESNDFSELNSKNEENHAKISGKDM